MQRNTLLLTAILAVIATLIIGVNIGRNLSRPTTAVPIAPSVTSVPTPAIITQLPYISTKCGVSLNYPSNFEVKESTASATAFINTKEVNQSVLLVCQPNIPRIALPPNKIESMTIQSQSSAAASISAKLYHDSDAKDGTPIDRLIFTNAKKGVDIFVTGYGAVFNDIIASIKLQ